MYISHHIFVLSPLFLLIEFRSLIKFSHEDELKYELHTSHVDRRVKWNREDVILTCCSSYHLLKGKIIYASEHIQIANKHMKKILNISHYERNANQNYNEASLYTGPNDHQQKVYKQYPPPVGGSVY